MATTLSERALLVTLGISQWTARKLDRTETSQLNQRHGLTVEAARVNKKLLPLGVALDRVHQMTGAIRKDFAARTLPWGIDGVNILKATAYMEFIEVANGWEAHWREAVDAFLAEYPQAVIEAQTLLGSMFKQEDYPTQAEVTRRFAFGLRFMPVPDKQDWRIDVGDEAAKRLQSEITKQVQEAEGHAMNEAWRRVYELVERAAERLSRPENVFRDTLVTSAVELCGILPSLNITDDPELERVRQRIEGSLCAHRPDVLREDPKVREDVAAQMSDIMSKMGGYFAAAA